MTFYDKLRVSGVRKDSGCIQDGWLVLSPRSKNVRPTIFITVRVGALKKQFIKGASGAVVKNLNTKMAKNVAVPLPHSLNRNALLRSLMLLMT